MKYYNSTLKIINMKFDFHFVFVLLCCELYTSLYWRLFFVLFTIRYYFRVLLGHSTLLYLADITDDDPDEPQDMMNCQKWGRLGRLFIRVSNWPLLLPLLHIPWASGGGTRPSTNYFSCREPLLLPCSCYGLSFR